MFTRKQKFILFFLLFSGLIVALKLLHIDYMVNYSADPYKSFCNVNETFNCDAVAASPFSHIFGVPVALIGTWANLFLMVFLFAGQKFYTGLLKSIFTYVFALYAVGCVALALVSFIFVPALCFVCMIYWAISIATFVYLVMISKKEIFPLSSRFMDMMKSIWDKKILTAVLIIVFLLPLICAHFYFTQLGCDSIGSGAICCENYNKKTHEAFLGRKTGKVQITVYTDFECPWCKKAHDYVTDLMERYEKQIRFVRKDFPLDMACNPNIKQPFHQNACLAAYYAKCAGEQGKYWEYHDEVYENQKTITQEKLVAIGQGLALDTEGLRACAESKEIRKSVRGEIEEAMFFGITGTPAFRIFSEVLGPRIPDEIINDYLVHYPSITIEMLKRIYRTKMTQYLQIIDIRDEGVFTKGHLKDAVNIPLGSLTARLSELRKDVPVLLCDEYGLRSDEALTIFKNAGFEEVRTLLGGYDAWINDTVAAQKAASNMRDDAISVIGTREAYDFIQNNKTLRILDLRTKAEFERAHIQGAVNIPIEQLAEDYVALGSDTTRPLLVYCNTQNKSRTAARFLKTKGFEKIIIMDGGIQGWLKAGYLK